MRMKETVPLNVAGFSRSVLLEVLKPHTDCVVDGELVMLPQLGLAVACHVEASQDVFDDLRMTPIELEISSVRHEFEPTRFNLDGMGQTMMESIRNALSQWVTGAAPLLMAVFGEPGGYTPDIIVEETGGPGAANAQMESPACWRMYLSQHTTGVIGLKGGSRMLSTHIEQHHLVTLLGPALRALRHVDPQVNYCWLKMYLSRNQDGEVAGECHLNDAELEGGVDALKALAWPDFSPTFAFIRQYAIFKRIPCKEPK